MRADASEIPRGQVILEPQAVTTAVSLPAERIASIDRLRILAAIGIVWFHTEGAPGRQIAYAALPTFLLIFFSLITRQDSGKTTAQFLRRRWSRLLEPWLFWSVVYGVCRLARTLYATDALELSEMLSLGTLLAGTSVHLWYLPYAFMLGFLAYEVNRQTREADHAVTAVVATIVGMFTLIACAVGMANSRLPQPLCQWEFGLAAIPLGLAIGRCLLIPSRSLRRTLLAGIALAVLVESVVLQAFDLGTMGVPYGIATVLVCIAYCRGTRSDIFVLMLAPATFGIYLIHPLVVYGLRHFLSFNGHDGLFIPLTVCVSALVTLMLRKTPVRRFL